jgi:hypothetical protein
VLPNASNGSTTQVCREVAVLQTMMNLGVEIDVHCRIPMELSELRAAGRRSYPAHVVIRNDVARKTTSHYRVSVGHQHVWEIVQSAPKRGSAKHCWALFHGGGYFHGGMAPAIAHRP